MVASRRARINGRLTPDTLRLTAGETYRLRLIHIVPDWNIRLSLVRGDSVMQWRALAKDGAELPAHLQTVRPARLLVGPGETMDFEYRPTTPGLLELDIEQRTGVWKTHLPIKIILLHASRDRLLYLTDRGHREHGGPPKR